MPQQAIDFSLTGDNTTGALVKLDNNVKDLDTRVTTAQTAATAAGTSATNAQTTANTAKTTADTATTKANAAQTTANAALPKTGATSTPGLKLSSGNPPNISAIDSSGNATKVALTISNAANNSASAVISFIREGLFQGYIGLDTDSQWKVGNGSSAYLIWHQGNTTVDANNFIKKA